MKQLVFIHGGEVFDTYDAYLNALRTWQYEFFQEGEKRWKDSLAEELGSEWEVHMPSMPSPYNAKYIEWSIWFERIIPHLRDGVVLVGHSLGGIFLAKYLSEHKLPVTIRSTILIAAPATEASGPLADFVLPPSLTLLEQQGGAIVLYHSTDDDVVPYADLSIYTAQLPKAEVRTFSDRGHFLTPEFPEFIQNIKAL